MKIAELFQTFQTQEQAVDYLENVRWRGRPVCPYCGSEAVCRHASGDRAGIRWQCQKCSRAFAVTVGTIFHGTHIPLRDWFLLLALMLNAKKSASSCQIARDLGMRQPTVWSMMHRARLAMEKDTEQSRLLHGIVEADETYVGGRPRRPNKREDDTKGGPTGRGTEKTPVVGVVERRGRVVARPFIGEKLSAKGLAKFIWRHVDHKGTVLMTDQFPSYLRVKYKAQHARINHAVRYADGLTHTNTIEGFWALVKRAWYGSHHHYSRKYMALYISEACYKYNHRREKDGFGGLLATMVGG